MKDLDDLLDSKPAWRQCPRCNKTFPSDDSLIQHMKSIHFDESHTSEFAK
ncbi:MAG: C2H2-type zinc finger protein [Nitrosotalea sp.]